MNKAELFEFDLNGFIIIKNALSKAEIRLIKSILCDITGAEGTGKFSFFELHPIFTDVMSRNKTLNKLKSLCGNWLRFDHALGLKMTNGAKQQQGLHGGNRTNHGAFAYQFLNGKLHNGLVKVLYSLCDVESGDGGFVCIPGSHKANIDYCPPSLDSKLVINPKMKAGDLLIFTEALIHGSKPWKGEHERIALIYSYSPGCLAWKNPETLKGYMAFIETDIQYKLMQPPYVGDYDEKIMLKDGRWPNGRRETTDAI